MMNECEQIHPLLRGYLNESLSARDRRLVARHLNLCASARRELDRLKSGPVKTPENPSHSPAEPWDLKVLRWLFRTSPPPGKKEEASGRRSKAPRSAPGSAGKGKRPSALKPILGLVVFFLALAFLTHFIQNARRNPMVQGARRWLSARGFHFLGIRPSLELVLDLTDLPHWSGNAAPVALPYQEFITDPDRFKVYWTFLEPGKAPPPVDFSKYCMAVVFAGEGAGSAARFKRMEDYSDKTILWYDEAAPAAGGAGAAAARPWILQEVPRPARTPVLIRKIQ